ncbi:Type III pantothenate kinase [Rosistilla carotiformis]|uniref:Type III pantothenate kinase n=1 Tax=Rosistilla carotiformis TaxID=2528017 RepID=A0A518JS34_9BACT|nr:type III pantothenate kinase [Rosistilla carotiformis]QDV68352.1 Type III pantothenate kinase [Rosistilla carotiformis]
MSQRFRIAVDVGNSSIKIAHTPPQNTQHDVDLCIVRVSLTGTDWQSQMAALAGSFPESSGSVQWLIASVNSVGCDRLTTWIQQHRPTDQVRVIDRADVGIETDVRMPHRVGIDRLLAAKSGFDLASERSAIVIDAGTTITVDLVSAAGVFRGGAILPGLGLQFRALHEATDKLPRLEPPDDLANMESPGRDTQAAMELGVVSGIVGAIDRLIESFQTQCDVSQIFLTGGDAKRLSPAIRSSHRIVADMPLRGLYGIELSAPHSP